MLKKDFKDGLLEMEETAADVELDAEGKPPPSASTSMPSRISKHSCCFSGLVKAVAAQSQIQQVMKADFSQVLL